MMWILVPFTLAATFAILGRYVDDQIVRLVCRREGRLYSPLWYYEAYWQFRIAELSWFDEARRAGLFRERVAVRIGFLTCVVAFVIAVLSAHPSP
jgi:hypothetical protein